MESATLDIPDGATIQKNGQYFIVAGMHGYPIAGKRGRVPYHRFVLYESLDRPFSSRCFWCGYLLPWSSTVTNAQFHIVNADHLDGNTANNDPCNLVPSCGWCNMNRNWAEKHSKFWSQWRKWLADVPPWVRPNLPMIAKDFGIEAYPESDS